MTEPEVEPKTMGLNPILKVMIHIASSAISYAYTMCLAVTDLTQKKTLRPSHVL